MEVLKRLEGLLGISLPDGIKLLHEQDTWILIDDAQLAFNASGFWKVMMKDLESLDAKHLHIVIAATYDLKWQGSTPYMFSEYPHISDLKLDPEEAEELYNGYVNTDGKYLHFAKDWVGFKDTLLKLASGHVGVLTGGICMLHRLNSNEGKNIVESEALEALRDHRFGVNLARCFPCQKLMQDEQRDVIGQTILTGPQSQLFHVNINSEQGTVDNPSLVQLVRAGILSSSGTFSCLMAQWQYFNCFYKRPSVGPSSIETLILQAVGSISALRLCQSCDNDNFPKEAAFQQLFNEALTMQLPPSVAVCPELNTFAKDARGEPVTGELDFFVFGNLRWAIELLRKGDKITKHVNRFCPQTGKYRLVGHTAHLVVDCRGPRLKSKQVRTMQDRCTLYFADNFATVECKMRDWPIRSISLRD